MYPILLYGTEAFTLNSSLVIVDYVIKPFVHEAI